MTAPKEQHSVAMRQLAHKCIDHFACEEPLLRSTVELLHRTRQALLAADTGALTTCLEQQDPITALRDDCERIRENLRQEIALKLNVSPAEATLSTVMERVPADLKQRLREQRDRVRNLAVAADTVNRENATLVRFNIDFMRQLLLAITGAANSPKRYGPAGAIQEPECGPIVSAQG